MIHPIPLICNIDFEKRKNHEKGQQNKRGNENNAVLYSCWPLSLCTRAEYAIACVYHLGKTKWI